MSGNVSLTTLCLPLLVLFLPFMVAAASIGEVDAPFAQSRDDECWRKLPPVERGAGQPLPSWAKALAGVMPRTTAALLRLDLVHRTKSPLDPKLRARMRWVAAHDRAPASAFRFDVRQPLQLHDPHFKWLPAHAGTRKRVLRLLLRRAGHQGGSRPALERSGSLDAAAAAQSGGGCPLPSWAKALAASLPHTTAAMLDLDRAYRTGDSLDPRLAGAIRLVVARTIRSSYGQAYALSDLRRAGLDQPAIDRLSGDRSELPASELHGALLLPNA